MPDRLDWITTSDIGPDFRGPVERAHVPFGDPALARPMMEMLRSIGSARPDEVAIEADSGVLTFADLLGAVARLGAAIEAARPGPGRVVGVLLPAGAAYAIGVFACLAAGRVSVLLDEAFPEARNAAVAAETGTDLVLATSRVAASLNWPGVAVIDVAACIDSRAPAPALPVDCLGLDEPAFVLCTSGSSGRPKPIAHSQRTMLHWARTTHDALHVRPDDRVLSLSSPAALGGFTALLSYPLAGASSQMLDVKAAGLGGLLRVLSERPVTVLRAAPSMLRVLTQLPEAAAAFAGLRVAQTYGEPLMKADLAAMRAVLPPGCHVRTTYGSTEASGLSWFAGEPDDHDELRVATGTLMPDTAATILDDEGRSRPPGEAGELLIRSRYNALGEWVGGRLVAGRLEPDPFDPLSRIYRTGDIARCGADGVFVVLGRKDRMMKVNGQRFEPAEVEAVLRRVPGVARAEAVLSPGNPARLLAFVVPASGAARHLADDLRDELRAALPSFMMPSRIVLVPAVPLLPGGKVDTAALLAMAADGAGEA